MRLHKKVGTGFQNDWVVSTWERAWIPVRAQRRKSGSEERKPDMALSILERSVLGVGGGKKGGLEDQ